MEYEVVSRFYDRARDAYVDPGAPCPPLDARTVDRLVRAGCIVPIEAVPPASEPRRGKAGRAKAPIDPPVSPSPEPPSPADGE